MSKNRVRYTLDSTLESVNQAESVAEQFATQAGFQGEALQEITMAVREATINAVLHGNAYDPNKKVEVTFEHKPGAIEVTVRDQGKGFNVDNVPNPLAPENLLKQSGRGIFLIRAYMDEVRFRNLQPGTEMVLIKHVRGAAADAKENAKS
jgi:serine/threonine-protein kinase RsbW